MQRFFKLFFTACLLSALVFAGACAVKTAPQAGGQERAPTAETTPAQTGGDAAAQPQDDRARLTGFSARDLDGNTVTEAVFANADLTMLNVWGTFCGPCIREMPDLGELAGEYADRGVQIIGLVGDVGQSDEDAEYAREFVEKTGAHYVHLLPSEDLQDKVLSGMMYYPTTIFFDRDGYVVDNMIVGSHTKGEWKTIIERMLQLAVNEEGTGELTEE